MKKITTLIICAIALLSACENEGTTKTAQEQTLNRVIALPGGRADNSTVLLALGIGHRAEICNGCVYVNGRTFHIDCQGQGNYCATAAAVQLQEVGTDLVATTVDTFGLTSEDFFNMPARSLNYTDGDNNRVFLNIPAQLVYRDNTTLQFTFTGLSVTEGPEYENE